MSKADFISIFECTLLAANLDIIELTLIDDDHLMIKFKGGGKRTVNITADSYGAIIIDTMKHVF